MYQALYRKYRPKTFDDVVGQEAIIKTLENSIKKNIVSHAYLFTGPRGTGKTSIAKVFAKILNCYDLKELTPCDKCISCEQANNNQNIDIIEIDAASNNGVDSIREIRNKITLVPTNSKYKIYIIDEVHMLSDEAFNALLKTLEEPPSHVIFIFATTEPHKIPRTILSRCQRFDYKKLSNSKIVERLKFIAQKENINIEDEALLEIAKISDGGMRDSISLLDQALAYSDDKITLDDIHTINGTLLPEELDEFIIDLLNKDLVKILSKLEKYDNDGKNIIKITQELINRLKNCLIYINVPSLIEKDEKFYQRIKEFNETNQIYNYLTILSKLLNEMKNVNDSKLLLEIELIKNISSNNNPSFENNNAKNELKITSNNESAKEEKKVEIQNVTTYNKTKLDEIKKIRINNSLSKFSQKEREKIKDKLKILDEYLNDEKYGKIVSLIKDGELKANSDNYLMFMYNNDLMAESFNLDIKNIETLLDECLKEKYNVIAINLEDWNFIKDDFNKHKEKYVFKKENISLDEIFNNESNKLTEEKNEIDEMFNDIIEYE